MPDYCKTLFEVQMKLLGMGLISEAQEATAICMKQDDNEGGRKSKVHKTKLFEACLVLWVRNGLFRIQLSIFSGSAE